MNQELKEKIKFYFDIPWDDETISDELNEQYDEEFEQIIDSYGWNEVYSCMKDLLVNDYTTDDAIVNWCHAFWNYGVGIETRYIPDPYLLVAYLYYRVDVLDNSAAFDIFDSIAITILPIPDDEENMYAANADPKVLKLIDELKTGKIKFQ